MERRTLIRLLVGLGIGIPVAIEVATFTGLVGQQLREDDDGEGVGPTPTGETAVGVGDDLLPETPQVERVERALVEAGETWEFELAVTVENTGEVPYELRLGPVTTDDGSRVPGTRTTGPVPAGGTRTFEATWTVPSGTLPTEVNVVAIEDPTGDQRVRSRTVSLAKVPVQGS